MKRTLIKSSLSIALLTLTFVASAQTPPADPSAPAPTAAQENHADENDASKGQDLVGTKKPTAANPLKSPPTVGQDEAAGNNLVGDNKGQMASASEHPDFQTLDVKKRGYLMVADVKKQPWITKNFSKCDGDSDGHLTAPEYALCAK